MTTTDVLTITEYISWQRLESAWEESYACHVAGDGTWRAIGLGDPDALPEYLEEYPVPVEWRDDHFAGSFFNVGTESIKVVMRPLDEITEEDKEAIRNYWTESADYLQMLSAEHRKAARLMDAWTAAAD